MPEPGPEDILATIRDMLATLPTRVPSLLRVGPGVADLLQHVARRDQSGNGALLFGVPVHLDNTYPTGGWRLFDQWGDELHSGQIEALRGMSADVRIMASNFGVFAFSPSAADPLTAEEAYDADTEREYHQHNREQEG